MRLHHLSVTAFGPFVETAEVDFDALSDSGLFLLTGATGSGKSSVLDAVCFALFGAVPGDRQHAGRLRSDQAPATLAPSVTLELTLADRRFRIVRSPAWRRPKKRGDGTTPTPARVTVGEHSDGGWVHLTSRLDEAGDLLSGLLGMNLDQFCQVALLPQGHFQAFLRAKPDERQRLLARLFRTGRFERVEAWLRDHRLTLRRASDRQGELAADLVSRISEAASVPAPPAPSDLVGAVRDGSLRRWGEAVRADLAGRRMTAEEDRRLATQREGEAGRALEAARTLFTARSRVVQAADLVERLEQSAAEHAADRRRLERAARAAALTTLARLADERRTSLDELLAAGELSRDEVRRAGLDPVDLAGELDRLTHELAAMAVLLPTEQRVTELGEQRRSTELALTRLDDEQRLRAAEISAASARVSELEQAVADTDVPPAELAEAERAVAVAESLAAAHARLAELVPRRAAAVADHDAAVRRVLDLREHLLDLRERRIAGVAAELAGALVVGDDCPVCGSAEHPRPASAVSGHPDAEAERAAQRAVDDAQVAEHALALSLRELDAAIESARAAAGDPTDDPTADPDAPSAGQHLERSRSALTVLRDRGERHAAATGRLAAARVRLAELERTSTESRVLRAELAATLEQVVAQEETLTTALVEARGTHPALDAAVAELDVRRRLVQRAQGDAARAEAATTALDDATAALSRAALEAGFDDPSAAREAELPPPALDALERRVREHEAALASARSVLDEPDAWELLTAPVPDVEAAETAHRLAVESLRHAGALFEQAARADDRVRRLASELATVLAEWGPLCEQLTLATAVASFAEGKAPDNRLQMRLSAYVLAYRLSQVVAAANARLAGMSDRRYSLEHVGQRGAGESRGGLSLVVRDDWSGEARDPATLSGGETFVVSLALALGLADVVAHEASGADVQTLFVDEGFGSLDAETLDDVLDILDTLREGGRSVGVVSHVAEMRDRIPAQLVVRKARTGSTLSIVS